jgi:HAD superfamily hydrolase (TIGR01509 family)
MFLNAPVAECTTECWRSNLNIKGIMIDYGDTLAYTDEGANKVHDKKVLSILRKHGYALGPEHVNSTFAALYRSSSTGEMKDLREFYSIFLRKLNVPEEKALINQLIEARNRFYVPAVKLYDGAIQTLSTLQKKYALALVSNCAVGTIDTIKSLGLTKYFDQIVLSYEIGIRKPDKRIYLETLRRIQLPADECMFVADEISDLEGARSVGIITMLVHQGSNTLSEAENPDFKPDFECHHISQITEYL